MILPCIVFLDDLNTRPGVSDCVGPGVDLRARLGILITQRFSIIINRINKVCRVTMFTGFTANDNGTILYHSGYSAVLLHRKRFVFRIYRILVRIKHHFINLIIIQRFSIMQFREEPADIRFISPKNSNRALQWYRLSFQINSIEDWIMSFHKCSI